MVSTLPFAAWAGIYALTGFLALSLEIVWFRLMGVMLRSTAFTFGTLLAIYVSGLGAGSLAGSAAIRRTRRPGRAFLSIQTAVVLYAALAITLLVASLDEGRLRSSSVNNPEPVDIASAAATLRCANATRSPVWTSQRCSRRIWIAGRGCTRRPTIDRTAATSTRICFQRTNLGWRLPLRIDD